MAKSKDKYRNRKLYLRIFMDKNSLIRKAVWTKFLRMISYKYFLVLCCNKMFVINTRKKSFFFENIYSRVWKMISKLTFDAKALDNVKSCHPFSPFNYEVYFFTIFSTVISGGLWKWARVLVEGIVTWLFLTCSYNFPMYTFRGQLLTSI